MKKQYKRSHDEIQSVKDSCKRLRLNIRTPNGMEVVDTANIKDDLRHEHVEAVLQRLLSWMYENRERLPQTIDQLLTLVELFSNQMVQVDPSIIFYHLLFNQVVEMDDDKRVSANPKIQSTNCLNFIGIVPEDCKQPLSKDFLKTLLSAAAWVKSNLDLCIPADALMNCLDQLCKFQQKVEAPFLLSELQQRNYVFFDRYTNAIFYRFPDLELLGGKKYTYAPTVISN